MGCHGNHAFKHNQNKFFAEKIFWGHTWVPMNNLTPMGSCPGVARYVKLDPRVPVA